MSNDEDDAIEICEAIAHHLDEKAVGSFAEDFKAMQREQRKTRRADKVRNKNRNKKEL